MLNASNVNVPRKWQICPREGAESRWHTLYATLNPEGYLVITRFTHQALGSPDSYQLLYDPERHVIGMRPARFGIDQHAFPARLRGRNGGRRISAYRMLREFGFDIHETVRFHHAQLDNSGVLILDLKDTIKRHKKGSMREGY